MAYYLFDKNIVQYQQMGKSKITVSIGIAAYNEEKNIGRLLRTIFSQKAGSYSIKEILIVSDASTDKTVEAVKKFHRKIIKLTEGEKRRGQAARMNEILGQFIGNILVFLDADIILASENTLENLIKAFRKNNNVGLVGGSTHPLVKNTFTSQAVAVSSMAYDEIRRSLRGGNTIYACSGHILALSKVFAKHVRIQEDVYATDAFLYFSAFALGYRFVYVRSAKVWHRSPDNIKDQIKQNSRFVSSPYQLAQIFGNIVYEAYAIPKLFFLKVTAKQFLKAPIHSVYIFLVNMYCKLIAKRTAKKLNGIWNIALSTKQGF